VRFREITVMTAVLQRIAPAMGEYVFGAPLVAAETLTAGENVALADAGMTPLGSPFAMAGALIVVVALLYGVRRLRTTKLQITSGMPKASPSKLLSSRIFVRDMARLAEHIVMNDVPAEFWSFDASSPDATEALRLQLSCRERAPFFAPDKVGEHTEKPETEKASCKVRWQRASWCVAFNRDYSPVVADCIDTGHNTEKPALVLLLRPRKASGPPLITVAFRGSKTLQDYLITDASPSFLPLPLGELGEQLGLSSPTPSAAVEDEGASQPLRNQEGGPQSEADTSDARLLPFLASSQQPCVTLGCWKAYAGESDRVLDEQDSPRVRVKRAVERLLLREPHAQIVLTGHSLGGALATLCTFDLLTQSAAVRAAAPITLLNFAAPRMFNQAFQDAMSSFVAGGKLHALRVVIGADMIARLPPRQLGCVHGCRPRLLLHPADEVAPCSYTEEDPDDVMLWPIVPEDVHVCHALYLGGDTTPARAQTVLNVVPWPLSSIHSTPCI